MATRNTELNAAPERSVTGETAAAETRKPAEDTASDDAVVMQPEQEQTEDDKDNTDNTDHTDDTEDAEHSVQADAEIPSAPAADAETLTDDTATADVETPGTDAVPPARKPVGERIPAAVKDTFFDILDTCESVLIAMFVVLMLFTYLFSVAVVEGDSMLPTLYDADRLLLMNFSDPKPGDVVVLNSDLAYTFDENGALQSDDGLGKRIVKRLIATGNQTVNIDFAAGIVYVDGTPLSEPYTSTLTTRDEGAFTYPITVPEGFVFVLGDNRSISKDSRHPDVALIPEDDIVGKVWLRVYPFDDFMAVN